MSGHTPGPWTVVRDARTTSNGKKYGLEVAAHVPAASQRPWESAGYIPVADVFHPSNPIRVADYENPAIESEILATREANARLIATAPEMLEHIKRTMPLACAFSYGGAKALAPKDCHCAWHEARALLKAIDG